MKFLPFDVIESLIQKVCSISVYGDTTAVKSAIREFSNLNISSRSGNSLLMEVIQAMGGENESRYAIINLLLDVGADPNMLSSKKDNVLQIPTYQMDSNMIILLINRGCNPNYGHGPIGNDSLYDWALRDYLFVIGLDQYPEFLDSFKDEDEKLAQIVTIAQSLTRPGPNHLQTLRKNGALTQKELMS